MSKLINFGAGASKLAKAGFGLGIIATIISILGIGLAVSHIGPEGPRGIQGIPGIKGDTGSIGPQGLTGPSGSTGPRGLNGVSGSHGPSGSPGKDAPINVVPSASLVNLSGYRYHKTTWNLVFNITVNIIDQENDNMHIRFYTRLNESLPWSLFLESIGSNGIYNAKYKTVNSCGNPITVYWLVETWDGSDIGLNYYSYTV